MKRLAELETRRRALLARCEAQRAELSWRLAQLSPRRWTQALAGGLQGASDGVRRNVRHPFAWVVAAAALLLLRRPREALWMLARARGALALVTRTAEVLSLVGALRRRRRA
jgi:hypothetical protein